MGEDRELCLRLRRAGYRVVVSWQARAIHHDRGLTRKQEPSFRRFLAKRFLEVAYKLDGMLGAMRWVWTNRSELRYLLPFKLREMFVRMRELRQRRGHNYLQSDLLDDYVEFIREQYR
jgi:GT2 family glycosyltransferase